MKYAALLKPLAPVFAGLALMSISESAHPASGADPRAKPSSKAATNVKGNIRTSTKLNTTPESPKDVFRAYYSAYKTANSVTSVKNFFSSERLKNLSRENSPDQFRKAQEEFPLNIRIKSTMLNNNDATIMAESVGTQAMRPRGVYYGGCASCPPSQYLAFFLVKENGKWKIDSNYGRNKPFPFTPKNIQKWADWARSAATTQPSNNALHGKFNGQDFDLLECSVTKEKDGLLLAFQSKPLPNKGGTNNIKVRIEGYTGELAGQRFQIMPGGKILFGGKTSPTYSKYTYTIFNNENNPEKIGPDHLELNLEFGTPTGDAIPGRVVLRRESQPETWLDGTFAAIYRQPVKEATR